MFKINSTIDSKPSVNRRQTAHKMYLAGKGINEVCEALGLKRSTASVYLYEARCIKRDELAKLPNPIPGRPTYMGDDCKEVMEYLRGETPDAIDPLME